MKIRNVIIIVLLAIGIGLFGIVQFGMIPHNQAEEEKYALQQLDPLTHDFNDVVEYKNAYMGNSSNIINLFYHLPLSDLGMRYELFPETLTLEVDYQGKISSRGEEKVKTALIYNAMAAFTLIDNLEQIHFVFPDGAYQANRLAFQEEFGSFEEIASKDLWNKRVQDKLKDKDYAARAADILF